MVGGEEQRPPSARFCASLLVTSGTGEARRGESELWLSKSLILLLRLTRAEVKPSIANLIHQRFNPARAVPPSHFIPFHFAITATAEVSPSTRSTGALLSVVV
ncbi:hypothetical protein CSOJ01_03449 [Colletotrichum sojae]|uniref:Uncharacterized protein n=1 Tax=Colletotrichum sojae TaxID=2175907 RepID=A0A8H6JLX1_9PEZI|nr:hypothetical protein CSOJ01_03449 [Colletotrichum sojae]